MFKLIHFCPPIQKQTQGMDSCVLWMMYKIDGLRLFFYFSLHESTQFFTQSHRNAKTEDKIGRWLAAWWWYKFNLNSLKISYKTHFSTVVQLFVRKESTYSFKIKFQVSIQKPKLLNYCTACMKMCCLDTKWQNVLCTKFATFVTRQILLK